jgi:hypothetical protein
MPVITLDEVKTFLQITGTAKDALITALIPQAEAIITGEVNKDYSPDWGIGFKIPATMIISDLMRSIKSGGLKSESQGEYSYTREGGVALSASVVKLLAPYKVARAHIGQKLTQANDRRFSSLEQLAGDKWHNDIAGVPFDAE